MFYIGTNKFSAKIAEAAGKGDKAQVKRLQDEEDARLKNLYGQAIKDVNAEGGKPGSFSIAQSIANGVPTLENDASLAKSVRGMRQALQFQIDNIGLGRSNESLTATKEGLEAGAEQRKKEKEALERLKEENARIRQEEVTGLAKLNIEYEASFAKLVRDKTVNVGILTQLDENYWESVKSLLGKTDKEYDALSKHIVETFQRGRSEFVKRGEEEYKALIEPALQGLERMKVAMDKLNSEYARMKASGNSQSLSHAVNMIGINGQRSDPLGTFQAQQALERAAIQKQYNASLAEANKTLIGAELILEKRNLLTQKNLELDRLDYELAERKAASTQSVKDRLGSDARNAKSGTEIINEGISSAEDRLSDELSRLVTGQKTDFAQMFRSLGQQMIKESLRSLMQKALGHFGPHKPTGTRQDPIYVWTLNDAQQNSSPVSSTMLAAAGPSGVSRAFSTFGGLVSSGAGLAGALAGGTGGGGTPDVHSTVSYPGRALGGDVNPYSTYVVGEHEPELFTPRNAGTITPMNKLGGGSPVYHIDARGSQLGVENRISRSIEMAHNSAVSTAVRANQEHNNRTPQRKR